MRKQVRFITFLLVCAMMFTMAACGHKTYNSLEEWYDDNPPENLEKLTFSEESNSASVGFAVEKNTLIYKMNLGTQIFGQNDMTDSLFIAMFDQAFIEDTERNDQIIKQLSDKSGIDASLISIRFEIYNPGEAKPRYQRTYPK